MSIQERLFGKEYTLKKMESQLYLQVVNIGLKLSLWEKKDSLKLMIECLVTQRKN